MEWKPLCLSQVQSVLTSNNGTQNNTGTSQSLPPPIWVKDEERSECKSCLAPFGFFRWRHVSTFYFYLTSATPLMSIIY